LNTLPAPVLQTIKNAFDAARRLPEWPAATLHPWRRESIRRLRALKNVHAGQRAFIIGNGPSLRHTDLSKLRNEYTFGLNRIYLLFPELGFSTTYLVSINDLVIEQCAHEMAALTLPRFFAWRSRRHFEALQPDTATLPTFLYTTYTGPRFSTDVSGRVWEGATVTNVALQLAFHMGFSQVILIGVDHNFVTQGEANKTVVSEGDDPNHFAPNYFGKGFRWQLPDLETSEIGYRMARQAYERAGREVLDATVGGKLTIFKKVDYESLF
ncbi:MAG: 6-hydroxymethylpterin diphosphokinase MptE-like protein, partial [Anaerolineales bacterium]